VKTGILFDLDGTLWDSVPQVCAAFNRVFDRHPELHKHLTEEELRGYMGKQRMEVAAVMMPMAPPERWYDLMEELFAEQLPYLREHHAAPYPHLVQTLEALSRDYPLAIVSNCQTGYIETFLDTMGVGAYFADHECSDTGLTKGENIRLVMERNGIDRAFYLGDTQGDLNAADQAGIPFVHAAYGFGRVDRAVPAIQELSQLPALARKLLEG